MPSDASPLLDQAASYYQRGDFAAAARTLDALLASEPANADGLRLRGLVMARSGAADQALPLLAHARRLAPRNGLSHLHYGIGLLQAGRAARAAAMFRRASMLLPGNPAPWSNMSAALLALGHGKAARAAARRAVALAPQSAACRHALGRAERAEGSHVAAREAFGTAVKLDPSLPEGWVDYGLACYQLGDVTSAERAMRRAIKARPGHAAATANLAAFILLRGETDEALRLLRDLLQRDPACAPARLNLANALLLEERPALALATLRQDPPPGRDGKHWRAQRAMAHLLLGEPDAARAELDAIEPPYGDAEILILWRRILLLGDRADDAALEPLVRRMAELAEDETATLLEHRIIARFDLARHHDQRGRPDRAFENWTAGHRLIARLQPFSREKFSDFIDASIAHFDRARLLEGPSAEIRDRAPVFIVGLPRSGTSLTEQIISAHAQVHGAGERAAVHRCMMRFVERADGAEAVRRLADLDASKLTASAKEFLTELHALAPEAQLITDKMPGNARHLGFIAALLPGARIIHCTRDPRDIGLSIFQHRFFGWHPYAHDLADLGWTIGQQARLMAHWRTALPIPMLEVALSDWVRDFDATLARVLAFLDLPHDPACERFFELDRRVRTASSAQVRQPVNARGLGRWRRYEEFLAPMLNELTKAGLLEDSQQT